MMSEESLSKQLYTTSQSNFLDQFDIPDDLINDLNDEDIQFLQIKPEGHRWYQWFAKTDTLKERKLLIKLDILILLYLFLSSFVKTLDSSAVSYAYVSGMKEDLGMYGNQLTYQSSCYMAGFIFGQIPLTMLGTKLPIYLYLPIMDCIWGVFTLGLFKITNYHQLYALRFCIGLLGSFFFPMCQYILGSFYRNSEITKRSALYFCASQVGGMTAGYIQAAAYVNLNGLHGLEGWQWLYVIAFIITIPVSAYGVWTLPALPDRKDFHSYFLSNEEKKLTILRMIREGRTSDDKLSVENIKTTLQGWRFWVLVIFAIFFSQADGISSNSGLSIWLKEAKYSVFQVNTITTVIPAVTIFFSLLNGIIVDTWDNSHHFIIAYVALLNLIAAILLTIWNISKGGKMFAFFLSGTANSIAAVLYSWANIICSGNSQQRALTLSTMNTLGNTFSVWVPIFVWKTVDAPRYLKGYAYTIALDSMMLVLLVPLTYLYRRSLRLQDFEKSHVSNEIVAF